MDEVCKNEVSDNFWMHQCEWKSSF